MLANIHKYKKLKLHKEEIYRKNWLRQREIEKLNMKDKKTKRVQTYTVYGSDWHRGSAAAEKTGEVRTIQEEADS